MTYTTVDLNRHIRTQLLPELAILETKLKILDAMDAISVEIDRRPGLKRDLRRKAGERTSGA